jgi:AraC-like DNA-binding protein
MVLLVGATQGLFLALLLLQRKRNRTANRILAFLVISYSIYITNVAFQAMDYQQSFPHLIGIATGLPLLFGPLHYLYVRFMISPGRGLRKLDWLHFLPYLVLKSYMLPFHLSSGPEKLQFMQNMSEAGPPFVLLLFEWVMVLQGNIYMILSSFLLSNYSQGIRNSLSSIDKINLSWLRNITMGTAGIWALVFALNVLPLLGVALTAHVDHAIAPSTAIFIYVMGYLSLRQQEIFVGDAGLRSLPKYRKSGLPADMADNYLRKIRAFMENQKPYTQNDLTLNDLAGHLSMPTHHLSQIINERLKQNFFDFINNYRVEEAKKRLRDPSCNHLTILAIAYDVGFSSKSVFNSAFKKHASMTPSQFKKTYCKNVT